MINEGHRGSIQQKLKRRFDSRQATVVLRLSVVVAAVTSCAVPFFGLPPVEYLSVEAVAGDRGVLHSRAGLYYTIGNTTDLEISGMRIGFALFDADGTPIPEFGENAFVADVVCRLDPRGVVTLCTRLDSYLPFTLESLRASRFRVVQVTFSNGSVWRNPGSYVYRGDG